MVRGARPHGRAAGRTRELILPGRLAGHRSTERCPAGETHLRRAKERRAAGENVCVPRSNRPRRRAGRADPAEPPELDLARARGGLSRVDGPDGSWNVRAVAGSDKAYRCPGCDQLIPPGTAHVVVWTADGWFGEESAVDDRRHWHRSCWQERGRRRPGR